MIVVIFRDELPFLELMTSGELISSVDGFFPRRELSFYYAVIEELVCVEIIVFFGSGRI
jgi:hypothetical protein